MSEEHQSGFLIQRGYRPGAIADVVATHIDYYAREWGFGLQFEAKVAGELSDFLRRYEPARDLFLSANDARGKFVGSITIDGSKGQGPQGAHLRWFITSHAVRGTGAGRGLMAEAIRFCDAKGYGRVYLTTFAGLDAARHLYEQFGFKLVSETAKDDWSGTVGEQIFARLHPVTGQNVR